MSENYPTDADVIDSDVLNTPDSGEKKIYITEADASISDALQQGISEVQDPEKSCKSFYIELEGDALQIAKDYCPITIGSPIQGISYQVVAEGESLNIGVEIHVANFSGESNHTAMTFRAYCEVPGDCNLDEAVGPSMQLLIEGIQVVPKGAVEEGYAKAYPDTMEVKAMVLKGDGSLEFYHDGEFLGEVGGDTFAVMKRLDSGEIQYSEVIKEAQADTQDAVGDVLGPDSGPDIAEPDDHKPDWASSDSSGPDDDLSDRTTAEVGFEKHYHSHDGGCKASPQGSAGMAAVLLAAGIVVLARSKGQRASIRNPQLTSEEALDASLQSGTMFADFIKSAVAKALPFLKKD